VRLFCFLLPTLFCAIGFQTNTALATSWDWSGEGDALVVTHDRKPLDNRPVDQRQSGEPEKTVLIWNGRDFTQFDSAILSQGNTRAVSPIPGPAQRILDEAHQSGTIDPALLLAVITAESSGNPNAVSHAGAEGLMQLMPATAQRFGVQDSFDPAQNVHGGAAYLTFLLDRYNGDIWRTAAAYNAGEARIDRGVLPAESRAFANRVVALWINQRMGRIE